MFNSEFVNKVIAIQYRKTINHVKLNIQYSSCTFVMILSYIPPKLDKHNYIS